MALRMLSYPAIQEERRFPFEARLQKGTGAATARIHQHTDRLLLAQNNIYTSTTDSDMIDQTVIEFAHDYPRHQLIK